MKCWDNDGIILEKEDTESKKNIILISQWNPIKTLYFPCANLFRSTNDARFARPHQPETLYRPGALHQLGVNYPEHQGFDPHIDDSLLTHADCTQREHLNMENLDSDNLSSPDAGRW